MFDSRLATPIAWACRPIEKRRLGGWMRLSMKLGLVALMLLIAPAAWADPLVIRVGWSTMPGHMIPVLFSKPEILKHYGVTYTVQPIAFRGSSPQITALAAREVDLIASSPATLALSVVNARLDMRVVADIIQDGVPGYHTETFMVRSDSGIDKVTDLKGKRLGTNAVGSASDTAMRAMLAKSGLGEKRDTVTIEAAFPALPVMLEEKKVDLAAILLPELLTMEKEPAYKPLFTARDAWGPTDLVFLAGRSEFLDKNRAAVADFIEDYVRAMRWFEAPANHAEAVGIVARYMKEDPAQLDYLFTKQDYYRDPFSRPNIPNLQSAIDQSKSLGVIPATIKVLPKYYDGSFLDEAQKRIETAP